MNDSIESRTPASSAEQKNQCLRSRGFISLLSVSFFGAANDNILKQILVLMVVAGGLWANRLGAGSIGYVSLVLTLPFVFLSGYAGQIADKFSKRDVILWVKIAEVPIAAIALAGLLWGSFWLSLFALLLLAIQSSFYGPAKFGIIPEVVHSDQLSKANGFINAISNVAVILGSLIAGPLADLYYPTVQAPVVASVSTLEGSSETVPVVSNTTVQAAETILVPDPDREPSRLPIGLALVGVSIVGLIAAYRMPKMKAVNPGLKFSTDLLGPHIRTLKESDRPLLVVLFSWSGFYLVGQLALMLMADLKEPLGVNNTAITNLIGLLAISIVIGSCSVAFLSGKIIRPYFSLAGAMGMTICFAAMGLVPLNYWFLAAMVFMVGIFAGFYIVPLQALLQYLSPSDERGRFFGTANALSFVFISAAGVIYIALSKIGMPPEKIPLVCAGLAAVGTLVGGIELKRISMAQERTRDSADDSNCHES